MIVTVPVRDASVQLHIVWDRQMLPLAGVAMLFAGSPRSSVCDANTAAIFAWPVGTAIAS